MYPKFTRGDICVVKQLKNEEINQISEGDVIQYRLNEQHIIHRVVKIQRQRIGNQYITKGDNNKTQDLLEVDEEQIEGIVKYVIPYLGYPSVWFHELLMSKEV